MGMIVHPYFPRCPSNNWGASFCYNTAIFSYEYEFALKI